MVSNVEENTYKERFENADNFAKQYAHQCGVLKAELDELTKMILSDKVKDETIKRCAKILRDVWKLD